MGKVEFRPLLVDGATGVSKNGFSIYARCEVGEADALNEALLSDGSGALLPPKLRSRARFTIAHEIAHTYFYDLKQKPPRLKIDVERPSSQLSLERTCNLAASILLIPESALAESLAENDWLEPEVLASFAKAALVSKDTLVRRLKTCNSDAHPWGVIASIERTSSGCRVMGLSAHYSLRHVFPKAVVGAPLSTIVKNPDFLLHGGDFEQVGSSRFAFSVEGIAHAGRTGSYLMTIRPTFPLSG